MKYCPQCGNKYPVGIRFCTVDGSTLTDRSEAETVPMKNPPDALQAVQITGPGTFAPARVEYILKKVWVDEGDVFEFTVNTGNATINVNEIVEETFTSGSFEDKETKEYGVKIQVRTLMGMIHGGAETINVPRSVPPEYIVPVKGNGRRKAVHFLFLC